MNRLSDYDYHLPPERIAQTPLEDRAAAKLLWLHNESPARIEHRTFRDCIDILDAGDVLVLNDTRVTAKRVFGTKPTGGAVEFLLLRYLPETDEWIAMARPGRRLQPGATAQIGQGQTVTVMANEEEGLKRVKIDGDPPGEVPLPPYILAKLADPERYQTVYASSPGSAAAPTAGLHFTPEILKALQERGIQIARVTLDVSIDTFRPIQSENLDDHQMHGETCRITPEAAEKVNGAEGRIIAVGTTAVRTLESFAEDHRKVGAGEMSTAIFIRPGYRFQIIDGMFTNFHMPRTSMLLMLSALAGRDAVMEAYTAALKNEYRFLSFGDSMLIL